MSYKVVNLCKTLNIYKTLNICKALNIRKALNILKAPNICKAPNIYKILLPLDSRNGIYRVSKAREDKASGPVLDIEGVITLLSINAKD